MEIPTNKIDIRKRYFRNDCCNICTTCVECLTMGNTCICNECGKSFTMENGYK